MRSLVIVGQSDGFYLTFSDERDASEFYRRREIVINGVKTTSGPSREMRDARTVVVKAYEQKTDIAG